MIAKRTKECVISISNPNYAFDFKTAFALVGREPKFLTFFSLGRFTAFLHWAVRMGSFEFSWRMRIICAKIKFGTAQTK